MQTFEEWLESQCPPPWKKSDARVAFAAGRRAGLEEAERLCEQRAQTHERNSKCLDSMSQLVLATHIDEDYWVMRDLRALASAPQAQEEAEHEG